MRERFVDDLRSVHTALDDLQANFAAPADQGAQAYARQMLIDHPELDPPSLAADAVLAIRQFHGSLRAHSD